MPFNAEDKARLEAGVGRLGAEGVADILFFLDRDDLAPGVSAATLRAILSACKAGAGAGRALLVIDHHQPLPLAGPAGAGLDDPTEADGRLIEVVQGAIKPAEGTPPWGRDAALVVSERGVPGPGEEAGPGPGWEGQMGTPLAYAAVAVLLLRPMEQPDLARAYRVEEGSAKPRMAVLKGRGIAPYMLTIAKALDGIEEGEIPIEFEHARWTMTPVSLAAGGRGPDGVPGRTDTASPAVDQAEDGVAAPGSAPSLMFPRVAAVGPVLGISVSTRDSAYQRVRKVISTFPAGETTNVIAKAAGLSMVTARQEIGRLAAQGRWSRSR